MTELLTVKEAAAHLRVCTKTIYALCRRGDLACVRVGRAVRIPVDGLNHVSAAPAPAPSLLVKDYLS